MLNCTEYIMSESVSPKVQRLKDIFEELKNRHQVDSDKKKYTQKKFAESFKSTQAHVSKVFNGEKPIGRDIEMKILMFLNINREWWETGQGEMFLDNGSNIQSGNFIVGSANANVNGYRNKTQVRVESSNDDIDTCRRELEFAQLRVSELTKRLELQEELIKLLKRS